MSRGGCLANNLPIGAKSQLIVTQTLFFLANLDPLDGSAHALYCVRNVLSLSKNAPAGWRVELIHASHAAHREILDLHHAVDCWNIRFTALPHIRRGKHCPFHINAVFHFSTALHLRTHARAGDIVCTASFPELFRSVAPKTAGTGVRLVYEIHQLEILSRDGNHRKCVREFDALSRAQQFITTCMPLMEILQARFPHIPCANLGLAASYNPVNSRPAGDRPFKLGYFGSISKEQGIPWLVQEWKKIRSLCGLDMELHVFGRARRNETSLPSDPAHGIHVHDPVPNNEVPAESEKLSTLVIPSLDQAHRASIAFTKAYDYAGLGLPILAADLPTIREVLDAETHALYFPPGDANALGACISRIASEPTLAESISTNLRHLAANLSWDSRARRWWQAVMP
jgi:glycosyltransferase involved in cell wall biosynthesis